MSSLINILIQQARPHHISTLAQIWQEIDEAAGDYRPFGGDGIDKISHVESLLKHTLASQEAVVLLACNGDKEIVGTISGHVFTKPAVNISRVGVIYSLWVRQDCREQGIGLKLLSTLETELTDKGARAFQVGWDVGNSLAASWWQKRGYLSYEVIASKIPSTQDK